MAYQIEHPLLKITKECKADFLEEIREEFIEEVLEGCLEYFLKESILKLLQTIKRSEHLPCLPSSPCCSKSS